MQLFAITALTLVAQFVNLSEVAPAPAEKTAVAELDGRVRFIPAGGSQRFTINHRATRLDAIAVEAGRPRGLRMYLFDAEGQLLACDEDVSDGLSLGIRDGWQGPFTLVVKNVSREENAYKLLVE